MNEVGAQRMKKIRGHIPGGLLKQIFDHPSPTEEAATQAVFTAAISEGLAGWSERMQHRLQYGARYFQAVEETMRFAREAFSQVADEAVVDDETAEVTDTDSRIKGLHPERDRT